MKKFFFTTITMGAAFALLSPVSGFAQEDGKGEKGSKDKKESRHITITTRGDQKEKIVVEVNGDKVTINGKPAEEFKAKDGDITVNVNKLRDADGFSYFRSPKGGTWKFNGKEGATVIAGDENRAMLGVTTEKVAEGAEIQSITKESAAEKAGLKENDIITKLGDAKIEGPEDLSAAVKKHKPGDKVTISYIRDKKEQKLTAELSKWKGMSTYSFTPGQNFKMNLEDFNFDKVMPRIQEFKSAPFDRNGGFSWSGGSPKLGISVQDTDDGKGVKVVNVEEETNAAKAGIKEDDIITHLDDKAISSTDQIAALLKEKKDQPTVRFQLNRNGKSQNIEVKMPRKIKTTNL